MNIIRLNDLNILFYCSYSGLYNFRSLTNFNELPEERFLLR